MNSIDFALLINELPDEMVHPSDEEEEHRKPFAIRYLLPIAACLIVGIVCAVIAPNLRVQTPPTKPPTDTTIFVSDTTTQSAETTTVTGKHSGVSVSSSISAVTSANADDQTDTNSATESTANSSLSAQGTESNVTTQTDPSQSVICTATTTTTKRTSSTTTPTKRTSTTTTTTKRTSTTTTTTRTTPTTTGTTRSDVTMVFSSEEMTLEATDPGPQPTVYQYHVPAARTVKTETVPCEKTIVCEDFQAEIYRDGFPSGMDFDVDPAFDFSAYDCMLIRFRTSSEAAVVSKMLYNNYKCLRIYIPLFPNRQADTAQIFTMAVAVPKELHLSNSIEVMPCPSVYRNAKELQDTIEYYDQNGVTFTYDVFE